MVGTLFLAAAGAFVAEGIGVRAEAWAADGGTVAADADPLAAAVDALAAAGLFPAAGAFTASPSGQMAERRRTRCPG